MNRRDVNKLLAAAPLFPGLFAQTKKKRKSYLEELGLDSCNNLFVRDNVVYLKGFQGEREVVIGLNQEGKVVMAAVPFVDLSGEPPTYVGVCWGTNNPQSWMTYLTNKQREGTHPNPVYLFPKEKVTEDLFYAKVEKSDMGFSDMGRVFLDVPVLGLPGQLTSYRGLFRIYKTAVDLSLSVGHLHEPVVAFLPGDMKLDGGPVTGSLGVEARGELEVSHLCWMLRAAIDFPHVWKQTDYLENKTYSQERLFDGLTELNAILGNRWSAFSWRPLSEPGGL